MQSVTIRRLVPPNAQRCERVLRALPDWFGMETALRAYADAADRLVTFGATADGEDMVGFLCLDRHNQFTAEIHVMAVLPTHHRKGIGRSLLQAAIQFAQSAELEFLEVKTLGPTCTNLAYEKTRRFYERVGFRPVEELHGVWPGYPCLLMILPLCNSVRECSRPNTY